jgi:hypothetical protein
MPPSPIAARRWYLPSRAEAPVDSPPPDGGTTVTAASYDRFVAHENTYADTLGSTAGRKSARNICNAAPGDPSAALDKVSKPPVRSPMNAIASCAPVDSGAAATVYQPPPPKPLAERLRCLFNPAKADGHRVADRLGRLLRNDTLESVRLQKALR